MRGGGGGSDGGVGMKKGGPKCETRFSSATPEILGAKFACTQVPWRGTSGRRRHLHWRRHGAHLYYHLRTQRGDGACGAAIPLCGSLSGLSRTLVYDGLPCTLAAQCTARSRTAAAGGGAWCVGGGRLGTPAGGECAHTPVCVCHGVREGCLECKTAGAGGSDGGVCVAGRGERVRGHAHVWTRGGCHAARARV